MGNRRKQPDLPLRPYMQNLRTYDTIATRACLHRDAYIMEDGDGLLYFVVEQRAGGYATWRRDVLNIHHDGTMSPAAREPADSIERHMRPKFMAKHPYVQAAHEALRRSLNNPSQDGFKAISVKLHYVYTDRSIIEPTAGLPNYYAGPNPIAPLSSVPTPAPEPAKLSTRDRSILRTLQKLLD